MTDTATNQTQQEQWVLVDFLGRIVPESNLKLVRVKTRGFPKEFPSDVELAMSDPSNVYRVDALPGLVDIAEWVVKLGIRVAWERECAERGGIDTEIDMPEIIFIPPLHDKAIAALAFAQEVSDG